MSNDIKVSSPADIVNAAQAHRVKLLRTQTKEVVEWIETVLAHDSPKYGVYTVPVSRTTFPPEAVESAAALYCKAGWTVCIGGTRGVLMTLAPAPAPANAE